MLINYNKGNIDVKNRHLDIIREGKGGMICENTTETCTLPYVKQMTSASSMQEAGHQSRCSGTTQMDRVGWQVGGEFTGVTVASSC